MNQTVYIIMILCLLTLKILIMDTPYQDVGWKWWLIT